MQTDWQIKMLYDGLCPLCSREVSMLRRADRHGRIAFEDIADPAFDPTRYGLTMEQVVSAMHGILPDGSVLRGVDVFARLYRAVGWNLLARIMESRTLRPLTQAGYFIFRKVRPYLSRFDPSSCPSGACGARRPPPISTHQST